MNGFGRSDPRAVASLMPPGARLLVIYDGWCGVCTRAVDWARARDTEGRLAVMPNQQPDVVERLGLTHEAVKRSAWAVDRSGRRYEGAAAVNRTLREVGGAWGVPARLERLPGIAPIEGALYRWFSANRRYFGMLGSAPGCGRPGATCRPEGTTAGGGRPRSCCGGGRRFV